MNQKVSSFLFEQKEFITEECIQTMITLFERGPMNITFLADTIGIKQHRMSPVIAVLEAFGFIELYKAGQSKEYSITDFGTQYLKQQDLLPEKEEKEIPTVTPIVELPKNHEKQTELLLRIFRLISLGKRNTIEEIAETMELDIAAVKAILEHLTLSKMVKNAFVERVRRYQLTTLGETYYQFLRGNKKGEEVQKQLQEQTPRLFDTLVGLSNGSVLYQDELSYALTLGLAGNQENDITLTELGNKIVKAKN